MNLHIDTTHHNGIFIKVSDSEKEYSLKKETTSWASQILLPAIEELLKAHCLTFKDISSVTVGTGPGSYTGIRVGIAVAQTIAWILDIPLNGKKNNTVSPVYGENDKFGELNG
ncbi:tRNA (adenosine(37)-N6)-threonylcarbamoyltransferase complex dimerization subunit type 1 TsaB [Candidatus Gottesmanbacteria bacterium RIFCSPHIGHO2_02_FULL_39_11]|uniref:tRNA (Adenosine(37)-N6)-threonylcarbamoyltransferase complex dimerization subunit type 1 TsaB n=1 Tax=Candidatus Gottesmanbacteria bacterium RIFCSPHIGHO2_02_FULL_39_11 TaxID=1798382 RepID=A0A1F5ZKB9_9BACT|nr:MAG: tRNA (adenosine(37)-N6)-threonylcarbamoyltransferase complex dimerization subunit type 1 TsaB [Candidatus Gottesmanbacteria bacterium RIFCSPHIGHO2_02_FULL_39_11]